jgi:hypothetical protein
MKFLVIIYICSTGVVAQDCNESTAEEVIKQTTDSPLCINAQAIAVPHIEDGFYPRIECKRRTQ